MGFIEKVVFYFALALGIVVFLKLDKRLSILSRLLISGFAVLVLVLLFVFISALLAIILVVVVVLLLISFLERKRMIFWKHRLK